ncbi:MAG: hypothetical protein OEM62_03850, partial [Acidobacteriota bacterium]|nr:hypothetical protein [Acidobacteriota bacterium]
IERLERGDLFDRTRAFASGPLRQPLALHDPSSSSKNRLRDAIRVLVISESAARQSEISAYLEQLMADDRFHVALKIRPGEDPPHIAATGIDLTRIEIVSTSTVYEAFADADVVVGSYSSALFEAAIIPRPTVILKTSFPYGHELAEDGLSDLAENPAAVVETVLRATATAAEELRRRTRRLWGDSPGAGVAQLLDFAEERLWQAPN